MLVTEPFWNSKVHRPHSVKFNSSDEMCELFINSGLTLIKRVFTDSGKCFPSSFKIIYQFLSASGVLVPLEFEKDDDVQVDFLYSISCLICDCYNILRPLKYKVRYPSWLFLNLFRDCAHIHSRKDVHLHCLYNHNRCWDDLSQPLPTCHGRRFPLAQFSL
jgi:hypothetical protein